MSELLKQISEYGLVPVIKIDDVAKAVPLAKALCEGGLPVAEVTFRTACAAEAIEAMAKAYPDMIVGAGTVLTCEQADAAVKRPIAQGLLLTEGIDRRCKIAEHIRTCR